MSTDLSEFHQVFFEECVEAIDGMEAGLLDLDSGVAASEVIDTIFRGAHSIKGGAGMFGFTDLAEFTHVMETLLDEVRSETRAVTPQTSELLLRSVDCLRTMIADQEADNGERDDSWKEIKAGLVALLEGAPEVPAAPAPSSAPALEVVPDAGTGGGNYVIGMRPHDDALKRGSEPLNVLEALAGLGDLTVRVDTSDLPPFDEMDPEVCYLNWHLELRGNAERAQVDEVFAWIDDECELSIKELGEGAEGAGSETVSDLESAPAHELAAPDATEAPAPAAPAEAAAPGGGGSGAKAPAGGGGAGGDEPGGAKSAGGGSMRVNIDKVDALINLVGELVITQSMLSRFGEEFDIADVDELRKGLGLLYRNTRELQESVMRLRMLPIKFSFNRFPRLVRDLCGKLGKKVELELRGEQTELDKTVLEKIADPLVHVVRNSLDHGIEVPEARLNAGKPEAGRLILNAYHAGGNIVIEVIDDGAGVNTDRIREKALASGLITETDELSEEQLNNLIFHPGLSTADKVSDLSGRGVGMDVVRRNIRDLGGTVDIRSVRGHGSTLTIRLPLTLAILDGQLVRVGQQIYIVPLVSIVESLQPMSDRIARLTGQDEVYRMRDEHIPVIRLHEEFGVGGSEQDLSRGLLVVVEAEGTRVGLFVDDLLGQQQIVIKSLEENYRRVSGISGATILGDGTVALILDVGGLVQLNDAIPNVADAA